MCIAGQSAKYFGSPKQFFSFMVNHGLVVQRNHKDSQIGQKNMFETINIPQPCTVTLTTLRFCGVTTMKSH